jgi:phosphoglycolate phosphatase
VGFVGVTYGYGSREELLDAGATTIVDTVDELGRVLLG